MNVVESNCSRFRAKFVQNERRSVGPADRECERRRIEETIEKQQRLQQEVEISPLLNGVAPQQVVSDDDNNMVGYIGTSERRYIQAGSIPTLSSETARQRTYDTTDDFITGGVSS